MWKRFAVCKEAKVNTLKRIANLFFGISILFGCKGKVQDVPAIHADSLVSTNSTAVIASIDADGPVDFRLLKPYLPSEIKGFKTEGYPDSLDNFTGEPTGETNSQYTSGGRLSFIKHLFIHNETQLAVEIIDYKKAPDTYKGLYKMYDIDHVSGSGQQQSELIPMDFPEAKAKELFIEADKVTTIHVFVCNRFIVNVQLVNYSDRMEARKALHLIKLKKMIDDFCSHHLNG